jgi:large subunit ribosomal protein L15
MNLSDICRIKVHRKKRKRVGRGSGSGYGVTAGRGTKGAGSRTGTKDRMRFEGGQMPLYRRLPKKGFTNAPFKIAYHAVNVGDLERAFAAGDLVDLAAVQEAGFAPKNVRFLKILGFGDLKKSLRVRVHGLSAGARKKIEDAKGSVEVLPTHVTYRPKGVAKEGRPKGVAKEGRPKGVAKEGGAASGGTHS